MRLLRLPVLTLALLTLGTPSCAVVILDEEVTNDQGSGFDYSARFSWNSLRDLEIASDAGRDGRPAIVAVTATVFDDRNHNGVVDEGESLRVLTEADADFDPYRVKWGPIPFDGDLDDLDQISIHFRVEAHDRTVTNLLHFNLSHRNWEW